MERSPAPGRIRYFLRSDPSNREAAVKDIESCEQCLCMLCKNLLTCELTCRSRCDPSRRRFQAVLDCDQYERHEIEIIPLHLVSS